MAHYDYTSMISMASDAAFRTMGTDFSGMLTTIGFTKTADTGQIDWTTVARASAGNVAGYEIRKFTDTIGDLYVKIEYGSGAAGNTTPAMWVTVGTGSNGSGTITGTVIAREAQALNGTVLLTSTNYVSAACMTQGAVWFAWSAGQNTAANGGRGMFTFMIARSCDDTGVPTNEGIAIYTNTLANFAAYFRCYSLSSAYIATGLNNAAYFGGSYTFMPAALGATIVSGTPTKFQVRRHEGAFPTIRPLIAAISSSKTDNVAMSTVAIDMAPAGTTLHSYFCVQMAFSFYDYFLCIWD